MLKVIAKRRWHVVDARPPQGTAPRDGLIEAIARTPILGFRDDVAVRVRATQQGARIDVRSASRYGRHDLGANAARVRALIEDVDDVLAAPTKPDKQAARAKTHSGGRQGHFGQAISATDRGNAVGGDDAAGNQILQMRQHRQ